MRERVFLSRLVRRNLSRERESARVCVFYFVAVFFSVDSFSRVKFKKKKRKGGKSKQKVAME